MSNESNNEKGKKGLQIYDTFQPEHTDFALSVIVEVDPVQYWRDNPIFLKYIEPYITDMIEYKNLIPDIINNTDVDFYLEQLKKITDEYSTYENIGNQILDDIQKISFINDGEALNVNIPPPDNLPDEIKIYDDQGNIIKTIPFDIGKREYKQTDTGLRPISVFDAIPDDFSDDDLPASADETTIKSLPDSYVKDKLWIASHEITKKVDELNESSDDLIQAIEILPDSIETPDADQPSNINEALTSKIESWYGIPLVNLSPNGTPLEDSFILQIDTKKDWTLNITNISSTGLENTELRIDKTIPPGVRFAVGISFSSPNLKIYLKIEGDENLYSKSINLSFEESLRFVSIGTDPQDLKTLCGTIHDFKYWDGNYSPIVEPGPILPDYLQAEDGWIYSGQPGWAEPKPLSNNNLDDSYLDSNFHDFEIGGKYYPIGNWTKPAWNGGGWWIEDGWSFLYNGYLDRLFCRYNLRDIDFSIVWYQNQIGYPNGIKTFVSDHLHSNYIRYDYDNFQLIIDFNGVHYTEYITLPEFLWTQFTLRYKKETGELGFQFRDFANNKIEEIFLYIGSDLEFELMSLFAKFDKELNQYVEKQEGIFGLVMIYPFYQESKKLDNIFYEHKRFLNRFNPRNSFAQVGGE